MSRIYQLLLILGLAYSQVVIAQTSPPYSIGTKWTYESVNLPTSFVMFQEYEVVDSTLWQGELAYVVEPGLIENQAYMLARGDQVFFWDELLQEYQLQYDFGNDSTYQIRYYDQGTDQIDSATVFVDSIVTETINGVDHDIQYCRSTLGIGNIPVPFQVINGVGSDFGGPQLPVGVIVDDITNNKQRIRCFEDGTVQYLFTEVACDSTYQSTSLSEVDDIDIRIYPNPTRNNVKIEGLNGVFEYEIYSASGQLLEKSESSDGVIALKSSGLLLLRIRVGERWYHERILKLE